MSETNQKAPAKMRATKRPDELSIAEAYLKKNPDAPEVQGLSPENPGDVQLLNFYASLPSPKVRTGEATAAENQPAEQTTGLEQS